MGQTLGAKPVELLAPAGNMACLHAAVRAGAQAVYLKTMTRCTFLTTALSLMTIPLMALLVM